MLSLPEFVIELARTLANVDRDAFHAAVDLAGLVRRARSTVYFIGNGGSAAIASHMAVDWMNKGNFLTLDLNNPAALTCIANDYGYEQVFVRQLSDIGVGDLLVAISSSGASPNILAAVDRAVDHGASVIGLSGFSEDNPLQKHKVDVRFHIPSDNYAIVENAHMAILHAMLEVLKR